MHRPARVRLLFAALALAGSTTYAADLDDLQLLTQGEFRALSEDLGAALSFKPMIPSESLGITGFDIGIGVSGTRLANHAVWERATGGSDVPRTLPVPTIRVHKGLPFNIDVGATYSQIPSSNVKVVGAELRWAVLPGSALVPAVAVRGIYSRLSGVDQLDMRTTGLDVSVSKGFAFVTPYAGVGTVRVSSTPNGVPGLAKESFSLGKVFAGVNFNFALANLAIEADRTGDATSYGAKLGFRF